MNYNLDKIETKDQYKQVLEYIEELNKSSPTSDSETADIINHLGTLATEWAEINLQKFDKPDIIKKDSNNFVFSVIQQIFKKEEVL
ncbi:MAG: hypothetical protein HC836_25620 [Richelia sp. RM2_1_2]|nr:hypothetical protein [Richelia sp. RM2_1_2]